MDLILASTSPYRRALLGRLGLPFRVRASGVDEAIVKAFRTTIEPRMLAELLADQKTGAVARDEPDAVVIGSDQVAEVDGQILDKPGTTEAAEAQLRLLSGRDHRLITALVVAYRGQFRAHTDVTTLTMRALDDDAIRRYVDADRPLDCAGSYKIEARGITLFERIDSADHTAIVGLPLIALTTILRSHGFAIP